MYKKCMAYYMENASDAWNHMKLEPVKRYGCYAYGHRLYEFDKGERVLYQCSNCGGYVLAQHSQSEPHTYDDDDLYAHYHDYFFVSGPGEADMLNKRFDGDKILSQYRKRYLAASGYIRWVNPDKIEVYNEVLEEENEAKRLKELKEAVYFLMDFAVVDGAESDRSIRDYVDYYLDSFFSEYYTSEEVSEMEREYVRDHHDSYPQSLVLFGWQNSILKILSIPAG